MIKNNWTNIYKEEAPVNPFPVAEPSHRVGPEGVSSGVSFRDGDLPEPCFEQVACDNTPTLVIKYNDIYIGQKSLQVLC